MASLLSFAFIALAFGLIDSLPVPELAYFNINPLGDIQGFVEPDVFDRQSPLINAGYNLGLYGEPFLLRNAAALGEDEAGFPLNPLGGLGGGIGGFIGGGNGGILDGGTEGILDGGSGGILDGIAGGIPGAGSGGILDDSSSGGIIGGGSGGILDNLPVEGGSGIPAGDGAEYLIGNYDEQSSDSNSPQDYLPDGGNFDESGSSGSDSDSDSENDIPGAATKADTFEYSGPSDSNSDRESDIPGADSDASANSTSSANGTSSGNATSSAAASGSGSDSSPPGADADADADTYEYYDESYDSGFAASSASGTYSGYYVQTYTTIGASSTSTTSSGILNIDVSIYDSKYKK